MPITTKIKKLTAASECEHNITIEMMASPLLNINHMLRVPLCREGKECGTTMPLVLYTGLKLSYMNSRNVEKDNDNVDPELRVILRQLLSNIYAVAQREGVTKEVMVSKTFQSKVFNFIVFSEPLMVSSKDDLLLKSKRNKAHTVSGSNCPSCTVPSYVCQWLLRRDGLNEESSYQSINSYVKRIAREVYEPLKVYEHDDWHSSASFSRRVQNRLFLLAFQTSFSPEQLVTPIINPAI